MYGMYAEYNSKIAHMFGNFLLKSLRHNNLAIIVKNSQEKYLQHTFTQYLHPVLIIKMVKMVKMVKMANMY